MSSFEIFDVIDFERKGDHPQATALDFDEEHSHNAQTSSRGPLVPGTYDYNYTTHDDAPNSRLDRMETSY